MVGSALGVGFGAGEFWVGAGLACAGFRVLARLSCICCGLGVAGAVGVVGESW